MKLKKLCIKLKGHDITENCFQNEESLSTSMTPFTPFIGNLSPSANICPDYSFQQVVDQIESNKKQNINRLSQLENIIE